MLAKKETRREKGNQLRLQKKREGNNWLLKGALLYEGIIGRVSVSHMKVLYQGDTTGQG